MSFFLNLVGCRSFRDVTIEFGWGGGFAGKEYRYVLNARGELKENNVLKKKLSRKELKELYNLFRKLPEKGFSHPYNTYSFVKIKEKERTREFTWGEPDFKTDKNVEEFYKALTRHLK